MPTAKEVEITGSELIRAMKKGVSLDKYIAARQQFGISPTRARVVASLDGLSIENYAKASQLGMTHNAIVGLVRAGFRIGSVLMYMGHDGVTLDEAVEAYQYAVSPYGMCGYIALRFGDFKVSHREIMRLAGIAGTSGYVQQRFLEFACHVGLNDTQGLEAAKSYISPVSYMVAMLNLEFSHEDLMDICATRASTETFESELRAIMDAEYRTTMAELRQQNALAKT